MSLRFVNARGGNRGCQHQSEGVSDDPGVTDVVRNLLLIMEYI